MQGAGPARPASTTATADVCAAGRARPRRGASWTSSVDHAASGAFAPLGPSARVLGSNLGHDPDNRYRYDDDR